MRHKYVPHLWGNHAAAIDVETTHLDPKIGEICQIAIVPATDEWYEADYVPYFHSYVQIEREKDADLECMKVNGISFDVLRRAPTKEEVIDRLVEWFDGLMLPIGKKLIPVAHNFPFEHLRLNQFLGFKLFDRIFHGHYRDAQQYALSINDKYVLSGEKPPFFKVSLRALCEICGVKNEKPHDALYDCKAEIELYRNLLKYDR